MTTQSMIFTIESVSNGNLDEALPLIRAYQEFYEVTDIDDSRNSQFFGQFGEKSPLGCQFICRDKAGRAVGFATVYFSFVSSVPMKVGIMNDLYTLTSYIGKGVGKALINHCRDYAISQGAKRLQWITAPDNEIAQRLYASLPTRHNDWKMYIL